MLRRNDKQAISMKIAYFDCFSGISGDMIIGALLDSGLDAKFLVVELRKLGIHGYKVRIKKANKSGINATKFEVTIGRKHKFEEPKANNARNCGSVPHNERNLDEIYRIVEKSKLDKDTKKSIKNIFYKIAAAESKIHKKPIGKIHFHEIGAIDTIVDVAGAVIGFKKMGVEKIYCSKLNVGTGFVQFSHGRWPVPAPATAEILKNAPVYHNDTEAELVTPTGAAIITTLASGFGEMPLMRTEKIGYGAGIKDLEHPNVLRIFLGQAENKAQQTINVIETNIDNMNPEIYPYVIDRLLENGAMDAYLTNIIMKKGRPAIKLTVLCEINNTEKISEIIFSETTTLGVRIYSAQRKILERGIKELKTKYGRIRLKISKLDGKIKNATPEYEDCVRLAKNKKIPLKKIYAETGEIQKIESYKYTQYKRKQNAQKRG